MASSARALPVLLRDAPSTPSGPAAAPLRRDPAAGDHRVEPTALFLPISASLKLFFSLCAMQETSMEANPDLFHRPPARAATGRNETGGPGSTRIRPHPAASAPRPSALATGRRLHGWQLVRRCATRCSASSLAPGPRSASHASA